jgi:hypothetical protein
METAQATTGDRQMTDTATNALIAVATQITILRSAATFNEVHAAFCTAIKLVTGADEDAAFAELLRRRDLIKAA